MRHIVSTGAAALLCVVSVGCGTSTTGVSAPNAAATDAPPPGVPLTTPGTVGAGLSPFRTTTSLPGQTSAPRPVSPATTLPVPLPSIAGARPAPATAGGGPMACGNMGLPGFEIAQEGLHDCWGTTAGGMNGGDAGYGIGEAPGAGEYLLVVKRGPNNGVYKIRLSGSGSRIVSASYGRACVAAPNGTVMVIGYSGPEAGASSSCSR